MNTIFKKSFFAIASLFAMLFAGSSCVDTIGIQVTDEVPNADRTLYQVITTDETLTDFVEVLNACNIPSAKNPNEIISVADSLFNTSRVYTVWAPANSCMRSMTVDNITVKDSILNRIKDGYRDDVMNTFVCSHIANYLKAAKGRYDEEGELILMLNNKKTLFMGSYQDGYTFGGNALVEWNNRVKNGIIHKLESKNIEYKYNIWEYIKRYSDMYEGTGDETSVDSVVDYLYSYNDTVFADYLSIPGPIVNGASTYLDSVFVYENDLLNRYGGVGELKNEDSLFTFYLPTNEVWNKMIKQAEKHFNYAITQTTNVELVDSLKHHFSRYNFIKYLTYSDNEQKYVKGDSVMPVQQKEHPRPSFPKAIFDDIVIASKELSNGRVKVINKFPYTVFDLWHDTIRVEAENTSLIDTENCTDKNIKLLTPYTVWKKDVNKEAGEEVSGSQYIVFGDETNSRTQLTYYLPKVKSASYKVALITVPRNITNSKVDLSKYNPVNLECVVKSYDPAKKQINNRLSVRNIQPAKNRIDTLILDGVVTFPVCEYESVTKTEEYTAKIQIKGNNNPNQKKYDNNIRLDAILLIPVEDAK